MNKEIIPHYDVSSPYDIIYRNNTSQYPVRPHTHNAAELYLTHTDLPDVLINDTISRVSAGSLIIIPPFTVHQLYHETDVIYERYILSIHSEWLDSILFETNEPFPYINPGAKPEIIPLPSDSLNALTTHFKTCLKNKNGENLRSITDLFSLLEQIDLLVQKSLPQSENKQGTITAAQDRVNRIISYINEHLYENISVTDLAEHFYLNPDYLSRLFKERTHTTIGHFISLQRITAAQAMFRQGLTISKVQETLGYSSYAHFAKAFKKMTGITPGQYKNHLK